MDVEAYERGTVPADVVAGVHRTRLAAFALDGPLVAAGYLANAVGVALFAVTNLSFRQAVVPAAARATAMAAGRLLSRAGLPAGAVLGGSVAAVAAPGTALVVAALGQGLAAAVMAARRQRLPARLTD